MSRREVVRRVLEHARPPYVPWSFGFTAEAGQLLLAYHGLQDLEQLKELLGEHLLKLGSETGWFQPAGPDRVRDAFGVVWNRSIDKDIGNVEGCRLPRPSLRGYQFPDPLEPRVFADIPGRLQRYGHRFRVFVLGFSLWERAWTLRGLENMYTDLLEHPRFAHQLLEAIAEWNLAQVREALRYDIDGVLFGDDWGQQRGLQLGPRLWREFLGPPLQRMFAEVKGAGRFVLVHSCGDVQELFEELIAMGLDCFNPFQPEVMDVFALLERYRGRLSFYGGLSTQRTLPYGSPEQVRRESRRLLEAGAAGGYLFSPAHDVEGDVPLANLLAFSEEVRRQEGWG